ncbi:SGNH/GDSL hydrolase family protein [Cytophagaceae bacterium YF14B1]|uniref:SGNH/GDSL hydrolase family protein n=1 Tax=Xanthocytophaga flava TaxID=3048013 RepID=A0AAE3QV39_9BACT|nr:SGNH/GDSL hydrolase family protein [Xanthocytophaga flavus]MDJ1484085.1 SGNH/GDSL hydrolase family protein [Xanthocytophaga flavus]
MKFFRADNANIQYTGRIDFSDPSKPRFWAAGVYVKARFQGTTCHVILNDEVLWGNNHNYLTIVIDDKTPIRLQMKEKTDTIRVAENLSKGTHTITICKNTESGIGYLELIGLLCENVLPLPAKPVRKLEFIGNSITCGTGSDISEIPCDKNQWYDQHNAYMAYGPRTARELNAQWHLTSVSGIGLIHSCCDMDIVMPQVFDKVNQRANTGIWDFKNYTPDAVTVCLGQNDGIQDSAAFCSAYVTFLDTIRNKYPKASIVCLTSPMANEELKTMQQKYLTSVVDYVNSKGDKQVYKYFFTKSWNKGCGGHPELSEHAEIAQELTAFLRSTLNW